MKYIKLKMNLGKKKKGQTESLENLVYRTNKYTYTFLNFGTINTCDRDIYNDTITLNDANKDQSDLLVEILNLGNK